MAEYLYTGLYFWVTLFYFVCIFVLETNSVSAVANPSRMQLANIPVKSVIET